MEMQSLDFAQLVSCLALGSTVKMIVMNEFRRDLEFCTFNIVETAIDYGDFGSSTKWFLHYGMFRYALTHIFKAYGGQRMDCLIGEIIMSSTKEDDRYKE